MVGSGVADTWDENIDVIGENMPSSLQTVQEMRELDWVTARHSKGTVQTKNSSPRVGRNETACWSPAIARMRHTPVCLPRDG